MKCKNIFKYYKEGVVIPLILGSSSIISIGLSWWSFEFGITISACVQLLIFFPIDKWLWKYKPFSWLFEVQDMSGTYEGSLHYQYYDQETQKNCTDTFNHTKIIKQTGSELHIISCTYDKTGKLSSKSENHAIAIQKKASCFEIIHTYENAGNGSTNFAKHYGTEVITVYSKEDSKEFDVIEGEYFTNRLPYQTKGKICLKKTSNKTNHPF